MRLKAWDYIIELFCFIFCFEENTKTLVNRFFRLNIRTKRVKILASQRVIPSFYHNLVQE